MIRDVTDLEVYSESLKLLQELYTLTNKLPKSEYDLKIKCNKAAKSIPVNISEGWAKRSYEKELKRFLKISLGPSDELITHLTVLSIVQVRFKNESDLLAKKYQVLSKRINSLCTNWHTGYF